MWDNAIFMGAGASHDAGIPLMDSFIERMWEFAIRGKNDEGVLSKNDLDILQKANAIRHELDGYHGRAMFDSRNIEDILSILSFNAIGGTKSDKRKLEVMRSAIVRTIELTCKVKHNGALSHIQPNKNIEGEYTAFWKGLFRRYEASGQMPTIITFNYDLVLERSLLHVLVSTFYNSTDRKPPFDTIVVDYHYDKFPLQSYNMMSTEHRRGDKTYKGTMLQPCESVPNKSHLLSVDLLKLHGSINFPRKRSRSSQRTSLTKSISNPFILPPIFSKLSDNDPKEMWQVALERLRAAKNVVIVGYSFPRTDIYMQYFLKTAFGPNKDLNKISVFDPVLFRGGQGASDMKERFACCFSPQIQSRINFQPADHLDIRQKGTFEHFRNVVNNYSKEVFF